jgi:uncharacterized lipoprotein
MKKLLLLLFVLGLMACGQKQEPAEEAPAVDQSMEAAADTMAADTMSTMDVEEAPEE